MKFVDAFMAKFKKVDDSEIARLRHAPASHSPEKGEGLAENTPLGANRPMRTTASKSVTRLRAFIKQKSPEQIAAEDAARLLANEKFTERAINDMTHEE